MTIIWMVATECLCCVIPMPQQAMTLPALMYVSPAWRISFSGRPDSASMVAHDSARTSAAKTSKPPVCWAMNA